MKDFTQLIDLAAERVGGLVLDTSDEFSDWVMLDIEIIERKVIDLFLSVADNTRIKLSQF